MLIQLTVDNSRLHLQGHDENHGFCGWVMGSVARSNRGFPGLFPALSIEPPPMSKATDYVESNREQKVEGIVPLNV
jgi:hypothetical protein